MSDDDDDDDDDGTTQPRDDLSDRRESLRMCCILCDALMAYQQSTSPEDRRLYGCRMHDMVERLRDLVRELY